MKPTCSSHITEPPKTGPFHDPRYCECLSGAAPILTKKLIKSSMRFQAANIDEKMNKLWAFAAARAKRS